MLYKKIMVPVDLTLIERLVLALATATEAAGISVGIRICCDGGVTAEPPTEVAHTPAEYEETPHLNFAATAAEWASGRLRRVSAATIPYSRCPPALFCRRRPIPRSDQKDRDVLAHGAGLPEISSLPSGRHWRRTPRPVGLLSCVSRPCVPGRPNTAAPARRPPISGARHPKGAGSALSETTGFTLFERSRTIDGDRVRVSGRTIPVLPRLEPFGLENSPTPSPDQDRPDHGRGSPFPRSLSRRRAGALFEMRFPPPGRDHQDSPAPAGRQQLHLGCLRSVSPLGRSGSAARDAEADYSCPAGSPCCEPPAAGTANRAVFFGVQRERPARFSTPGAEGAGCMTAGAAGRYAEARQPRRNG